MGFLDLGFRYWGWGVAICKKGGLWTPGSLERLHRSLVRLHTENSNVALEGLGSFATRAVWGFDNLNINPIHP